MPAQAALIRLMPLQKINAAWIGMVSKKAVLTTTYWKSRCSDRSSILRLALFGGLDRVVVEWWITNTDKVCTHYPRALLIADFG